MCYPSPGRSSVTGPKATDDGIPCSGLARLEGQPLQALHALQRRDLAAVVADVPKEDVSQGAAYGHLLAEEGDLAFEVGLGKAGEVGIRVLLDRRGVVLELPGRC